MKNSFNEANFNYSINQKPSTMNISYTNQGGDSISSGSVDSLTPSLKKEENIGAPFVMDMEESKEKENISPGRVLHSSSTPKYKNNIPPQLESTSGNLAFAVSSKHQRFGKQPINEEYGSVEVDKEYCNVSPATPKKGQIKTTTKWMKTINGVLTKTSDIVSWILDDSCELDIKKSEAKDKEDGDFLMPMSVPMSDSPIRDVCK
jgi:hypothetical protein